MMSKGPYQEMLSYNKSLARRFVLHGKDESSMTLLDPSRTLALSESSGWPSSFNGLGKSTTPSVFHKKKIYSNDKTKAKLALVNRDGNYHSLVYVTTSAQIKMALRNGVFEPAGIQDPLAKMIAELGVYKRKVFERSTELHVLVTNNEERLAVVDVTQRLLEALQPLNRCINHYETVKTPQENCTDLLAKLEDLTKEVDRLMAENNTTTAEPYMTLMACAASLGRQTKKYQATIASMENPFEEQVRGVLGSYGSGDNLLQYFLQQQLNTLTQGAIDANYAVTGLYQDASGLSQSLVNAQFMSESFSSQQVDYHNWITPEHSLDFCAEEQEGLVAIDLSEYGFHPASNVELAKRVALIARLEDGKKLYNESDDVVRFINFRGEKGTVAGYTAVKKIGFTLVNFVIDITTKVLDLLYAGYAVVAGAINLIARVFGRELWQMGLFPSQRLFFRKWDTAESTYAELEVTKNLVGAEAITQASKGGFFIDSFLWVANLLTHLTWKPGTEFTTGVASNLLGSLKNTYYDMTIGRSLISDDALLSMLNARIQTNRLVDQYNQQEIAEVLQQASFKPYHEFDSVGEVNVAYNLNPDKPEDFVSWASNDFVKGLIEVFSQEVYRVHPIGGLAFTLAASTAVPMAMPFLTQFSFLNFIYTQLNIPIAKALIGEAEGFTSAFSTAMIAGKAAFLCTDLANGKNSLFIRSIESAIENPVLSGLLGTAAVSFGFEIAFDANIPWLSEQLASGAGQASFPYFELGLSGAQLAVIAVGGGFSYADNKGEQAKKKTLKEQMDALRPEIRTAMAAGYKRVIAQNGTHLSTEEQERQIDAQVTQYLDAFKAASAADYADVLISSVKKFIAEYVVNDTGSSSLTEDNIQVIQTLQEHFKRAHIREQILELEPNSLSQEEKYQIVHYVTSHYAHEPVYIAAIKYKFIQDQAKIGGLVGSMVKALSYIPAVLRAAVSLLSSAALALSSLVYPHLWPQALLALQPAKDLLAKARGDSGLIVKALANMLRVSWGLLGSVSQVLLVGLYSLIASPILIGQYAASSHLIPTPLAMNSKLSHFLFAPGKISQLFNAAVGFFRKAASAQDLEVATRSTASRETIANLLQLQPLIVKKLESKSSYDKILADLPEMGATSLTGVSAVSSEELQNASVLETVTLLPAVAPAAVTPGGGDEAKGPKF
ncbi:MAG: hypothetical protein ACHP65_09055 [Legionellales bacterium]